MNTKHSERSSYFFKTAESDYRRLSSMFPLQMDYFHQELSDLYSWCQQLLIAKSDCEIGHHRETQSLRKYFLPEQICQKYCTCDIVS